MLLSNEFRPDPRVAREAEALARTGHQVTVVAWDRQGRLSPHEEVDGYQVERVQNVRSIRELVEIVKDELEKENA